jgi:DNA processing protein
MTINNSDTKALILSLASLGKLGPVKIKILLAQTEDPLEILEWTTSKFEAIPGIGKEIASRLTDELDIEYGRRLIDWSEKHGYGVTTLVDPEYPALLRQLYDPPPFFFHKGILTKADGKAVAIVGSRSATDYGRAMAARIAGELCRHEVTIVSGMAIGVDSTSHRAALEAGGRTIAVLGSGIDVIYPRENKKLYHQISEQGAVISEFFPGADPIPGNFPRRNRIIAGLSQAVIVVEAGEKSGALLTADLALAHGKKLFAVPGNLSSRLSAGTNDLIKSGANILTSTDDIFSVLPALKNDYIGPRKRAGDDLTEGERRVIGRLSESPKQLDSLVRECQLSVTDAASYLLSLELRGLIKQLSGKRFIAI